MWQWLTENRVGRDAFVWAEGWPEWVVAEIAFDDFFPRTPALAGNTKAAATPTASEVEADKYDKYTPSPDGTNASTVAEPVLGDRNRAERKQKRRRNYTLMIAGLTVIMLILIGTLIAVLRSQTT